MGIAIGLNYPMVQFTLLTIKHDRVICTTPSCHWICHKCFATLGCPRCSYGRCRSSLAISTTQFTDPPSPHPPLFSLPVLKRFPAPTSIAPYSADHLLSFGLQAANDLFLDTPFLPIKMTLVTPLWKPSCLSQGQLSLIYHVELGHCGLKY